MTRWPLLLVCCVLFAPGCGPELAANVDPGEAGQVLRTALDAWKGGKTPADLEAGRPAILLNDLDFSPQNQLLDYTMDDAGTPDGRQVRWVVRLKLRGAGGKVSDRKATYIIDTTPRVVIVRDSFAS